MDIFWLTPQRPYYLASRHVIAQPRKFESNATPDSWSYLTGICFMLSRLSAQIFSLHPFAEMTELLVVAREAAPNLIFLALDAGFNVSDLALALE
jgi:hypothetical protein